MNLENIKQCCYSLDSDRITKRRKAAEQLTHLLNNDAIVAELSGSSNRNSGLAWDQVFYAAKKYFIKEAEKIEKDERLKENVSSTTRALWDKHKRTAASLPKLVLKKSTLGGSGVSLKLIMELIFLILDRSHPYLLENYAGIALQIVQNYLLTFPQNYLFITQEKWKDLFRISIFIFEKKVANMDAVIVLSVMENVFKCFKLCGSTSNQRLSPSANLRAIASFLCKTITSDGKLSYRVKGALLSLLFTICGEFGSQWRCTLCRIGEETLPFYLSMWEDRETPRQILLEKYLSLQIMMHHPQQDGIFQDKSKYCYDEVEWDRNLRHLYSLIYETINKHCQNTRLIAVQDSEVFSDSFIELAARLLSKLFVHYKDVAVFEVSQLRSNVASTSNSTQASKRRKIEIGFNFLCDLLLEEGTEAGMIPWYHIITKMLQDHSKYFTAGRCKLLLDILTQLLDQTKVVLVLEAIIRCLVSLSHHCSCLLGENHVFSWKGKWNTSYDLTIRLVGGRQCISVGLQLLRNLIQDKFVDVDGRLYGMFIQGIIGMDGYGLEFLHSLLLGCPLPKHLTREDSFTSSPQVNSSRQLLKILVHLDSEFGDFSANSLATDHPKLLANVLNLLRIENPTKHVKLQQASNSIKSSLSEWSKNEELFLKSTFSASPIYNSSEESNSFSSLNFKAKLNFENEIVDRLTLLITQKLASSSQSISYDMFKLALNILELIVHLCSKLENPVKLMQLLHKEGNIAKWIETTWNGNETSKFEDILFAFKRLTAIYKLVIDLLKRNPSEQRWVKLFVKSVPSSIEETALSIISWRINCAVDAPQQQQQMSHSTQINLTLRNSCSNSTMDSSQDYDPDFDDIDSSASVNMEMDLFDDFDSPEQNNNEEESEKGTQLSFSQHCFTKKDLCVLLASQWLSCVYELNLMIGGETELEDEENESHFIKAIEEFIQLSDKCDVSQSSLVFVFINNLFSMTYEEGNVDDGLDMLSRVAARHSSDARVAFCSLQALKVLLVNSGSWLVAKHQQNLLHVVKVFAKKYIAGSYGCIIGKSLFEVNCELTKADPVREWSFYQIDADKRCCELFNLLSDSYHELRMAAAENLHLLFKDKNDKLLPLKHQSEKFQCVYQVAIESLNVLEGTSYGDFLQDEGNARVTSFLSSLVHVAVASPYLEPKAIYALFYSSKVHKVDAKLIKRALESIAVRRNVTLVKYLEGHLLYIISQWVYDGHTFNDFPYLLLEKDDLDSFIAIYFDYVIRGLFQEDKLDMMEALATPRSPGLLPLLETNLSFLLASIMPYLISSFTSQENVPRSKITSATKKIEYLRRVLGNEVIVHHLRECIGEVILIMLDLCHDSKPWKENEIAVPPAQLQFDSELIKISIENLHKVFFKNEDTLILRLVKKKSSLHVVLQGLSVSLDSCSSRHEYRRCISRIETFLSVLLPYVGEGLDKMNVYVIKKTTHLLTCFVERIFNVEPYFALRCVELLDRVVSSVLAACPQFLCTSACLLVQRLLSLMQTCQSLREISLEILHRVFSCDNLDLQRSLVTLPPFPSEQRTQSYDELRQKHLDLIINLNGVPCLKQDVCHFIEMPTKAVTSDHVNHILAMLKTKNLEINELLDAEDFKGGKLIHLLLHKLVTVISTSSRNDLSVSASECLGQLGPIHLNTEVFALEEGPRKGISLTSFPEAEKNIYDQLLLTLNEMTLHSAVKTVEVASDTLKYVLLTAAGHSRAEKLGKSFLAEVYPLAPPSKPTSKAINKYGTKDGDAFGRIIDRGELWTNGNFEAWLTTLTTTLIECGCGCDFIHCLDTLCSISPAFSAEILPFVFHFVLRVDIKGRRSIMSKMVTQMVERHMDIIAASSQSSASSEELLRIPEYKKSIQLILKIVNYLRLQDPKVIFTDRKRVTHWERIHWLDLDYLQMAKAAFTCGQYFSALLFAEFACEMLEDSEDLCDFGGSAEDRRRHRLLRRQNPPLQRISESARGREVCDLLFKTYDALKSSEGVEGYSYAGGAVNRSGVQAILSQHQKKFLNSLSISEAEGATQNLIDVLRSTGMFNILSLVVKNSPEVLDEKVLEAQAECAWKLGSWNSFEESSQNNPIVVNCGFNQSLLKCMVNFKNKNDSGVDEALLDAQNGLICTLRDNGNESCQSVYTVLSQLKIVTDFKELSKCIALENGNKVLNDLVSLDSKWNISDKWIEESGCYDDILTARITSLKLLFNLTKDKMIEPLLFGLLIKKCQFARSSQPAIISQCKSALLDIDRLGGLSLEQTWQYKIEEALFAKALSNNRQAVNILTVLLKEAESQDLGGQRQMEELCKALNLCGKLLMDSKAMPPKDIMENYLVRSVGILEQNFDAASTPLLPESYQQFATFSDKLYQKIKEFQNSEQIKNRIEQLSKSKKEIANTQKLENEVQDLKERKEIVTKLKLLERDAAREEKALLKLSEEEEFYLKSAIENYLKCLKSSSDHNFMIFRVVALWFENLREQHMNDCMKHYGAQLTSHQFLPLLYQLVARLTVNGTSAKHHRSFPWILFTLLERICKDHPHHALPAVLMLSNSHLDGKFSHPDSKNKSLSRRRSSKDASSSITEERVQAAKSLVDQLKKSSLREHIDEMQAICEAYIHLAYAVYPFDRRTQNAIPMVKEPLMRLRNLKHTAPLVKQIPIQPSGSYSPPLIVKWGSTFANVGGINAPKKLTVRTSDGFEFNELLKGNDDLRQDAVLEQVFNVVNELLKKDTEAKKRKLSLRTYMVVPLSQKCGLIEWCNNTMAFREYIDKTHNLYYPHQFQFNDCHEMFKKAGKQSHDVLLQTFEEILDNYYPVLRLFFFEKYPQAEKWFTRRQMFTRSVATSSIAGYIFGIGDRHTNNILLDVEKAELIHIDLGIAFEAGHLLPTPETVPFRLTQNMIDGLGATGVEGALRKSMEITLTVLREASSVLTTIVDVLRHDPLYQWTLTPEQVARLQEEGAANEEVFDTSRSMAERALLRVQQKLNGLQDGLVYSVPDHVSALIQQATDNNNLSKLFCGWAPYV